MATLYLIDFPEFSESKDFENRTIRSMRLEEGAKGQTIKSSYCVYKIYRLRMKNDCFFMNKRATKHNCIVMLVYKIFFISEKEICSKKIIFFHTKIVNLTFEPQQKQTNK